MHSSLHIYIHTYIHTTIHTYIYTFMHILIYASFWISVGMYVYDSVCMYTLTNNFYYLGSSNNRLICNIKIIYFHYLLRESNWYLTYMICVCIYVLSCWLLLQVKHTSMHTYLRTYMHAYHFNYLYHYLISTLSLHAFISIGITQLIPDPHFKGSGVHQTLPGGWYSSVL